MSYMQILIYRTRHLKHLFDKLITHSCLNNELTVVVNKNDRACKTAMTINTLINSISIIDCIQEQLIHFINVKEIIN